MSPYRYPFSFIYDDSNLHIATRLKIYTMK